MSKINYIKIKNSTLEITYKGGSPSPGRAYNPPPYPLPNVNDPIPWVKSTNSCWRDAKKEYNNSTKWPMTVGYWGACPKGGCGGGGKDVDRNFDDIDMLWDVVILSFIEFQNGNPMEGLCLNLSSHYDAYPTTKVGCSNIQIPTLKESIQERQRKGGFVLASLGGANGSKPGTLGVDNAFSDWVTIANQYNLDGIDIDIEASFDRVSYIEFLKKVADGGWVVSCAPILSNQQIGSTYNASTCVCPSSNNRTWCDVSEYKLEEDRPYNEFIQPDMIGYVDIINLQIYNNVVPESSGLFEPVMYEWLATFAIWCQGSCSVLDCPATPGDCETLPSSFKMIEPTQTITCPSSNSKPSLTPRIIKQKFYMGFCGQDCPTFHFDPNLIKKLLPYFRGIMFWAIDESLNPTLTSPTATDYIKTLLK